MVTDLVLVIIMIAVVVIVLGAISVNNSDWLDDQHDK